MHIYLDNASTTPMFPDVIQVMTEVMTDNYGNPSSIHFHGRKSKSIIENARRITANVINASLSEIFFTSSATEANNMVLKNVVQDHQVQRVITSPTEHHCVLHSLDYLQEVKNIEIVVLNVDSQGNIDYDQLETLLKEQDKKTLVSIMHGNNEIGTMSDLHKIGALCAEYQALFHCDTVQTVGKYAIDVQSSKISFLSGSAHKFHGPKGAGFVFISNDFMLSPYIHGGAQERNMRAGTENVVAIAGLAKALEQLSGKMSENEQYIRSLREEFKSKLTEKYWDIRYNGRQDSYGMAHVLSVSFPPGPKADMLVMNLDIAGISVSSGSACSAGIEEDSHVLKAIGHPSERKTIRFSFSVMNTMHDIQMAIDKLTTLTPVKT